MLCRDDFLAAEKSLNVWRWRCCMAVLAKTKDAWGIAVPVVPREGSCASGRIPTRRARVVCWAVLQYPAGLADSPTSRHVPSQGNPASLGMQTHVKRSGFLQIGHSQHSGLQMGLVTFQVVSSLHNSVISPVSLKMWKVQLRWFSRVVEGLSELPWFVPLYASVSICISLMHCQLASLSYCSDLLGSSLGKEKCFLKG